MTDQELINGCIRKNATSQRLLFEQYAGRMMTICRRYACDQKEAEDMLQEAFIRVFTYIHQYKFNGPLAGWIRRIVINAALKILQSKKIQFAEIGEEEYPLSSIDPDALSNLTEDELLKLIGNLPPGYRIVFNLYVIEGYDHEEIARMLGIRSASADLSEKIDLGGLALGLRYFFGKREIMKKPQSYSGVSQRI